MNFRRYDVSDHNFFFQNPGAYFGYTAAGSAEVRGWPGLSVPPGRSTHDQRSGRAVGHRLLRHGRVERNQQPEADSGSAYGVQLQPGVPDQLLLQLQSAASPAWPASTPSTTAAIRPTYPTTRTSSSGLHQAYPGVDAIDMSPRIGFSWSPGGSSKTVVSGGFGIFYDNPPAGLVDNELANPPTAVQIRVRPDGGTPAFDPTASGSAATFPASAAAFNSGYRCRPDLYPDRQRTGEPGRSLCRSRLHRHHRHHSRSSLAGMELPGAAVRSTRSPRLSSTTLATTVSTFPMPTPGGMLTIWVSSTACPTVCTAARFIRTPTARR